MIDRNNNGIPDSQELWFLIARCAILVWSMGMLSYSYFAESKIDNTFMASTMTAAAASFGIRRHSQPK